MRMMTWIRKFYVTYVLPGKKNIPENYFLKEPGYDAFLNSTLKICAEAELVAHVPDSNVQRSPINGNFFIWLIDHLRLYLHISTRITYCWGSLFLTLRRIWWPLCETCAHSTVSLSKARWNAIMYWCIRNSSTKDRGPFNGKYVTPLTTKRRRGTKSQNSSRMKSYHAKRLHDWTPRDVS